MKVVLKVSETVAQQIRKDMEAESDHDYYRDHSTITSIARVRCSVPDDGYGISIDHDQLEPEDYAGYMKSAGGIRYTSCAGNFLEVDTSKELITINSRRHGIPCLCIITDYNLRNAEILEYETREPKIRWWETTT